MFDGWPDAGHKAGIPAIEGKYLIENGTAVTGTNLPAPQAVPIDLSVRKESISLG